MQQQRARRFSVRRGAAKIVFGAGCSRDSAALARELDALGAKKVLVVCTPGRATDAKAIAAAIGPRAMGVYADAREHVPVSTVSDAQRAAEGADAFLALGGGSAIGLAKALALHANARVVAIPTTYSGSEMTPIHGTTEGGVKRTGRDERVRPALVFYDSERLATLPRRNAVPSLWNAAAHAIEALWIDPEDRATHAIAEQALALVIRSLRASTFGDDALEGAYLAGLAFADAGSGIHHKLCHELGGRFALPHAATHAALLPHVVRFQRTRAPAAMSALARVLRVVDPAAELMRLALATGVPTSLEELGMPREGIASIEDGREILEAAWPRRATPEGAATLRGPETVEGEGGFGGAHESEALPGALPRRQNAPRHAPYGLIPELVNGMPFTVKNVENSRIWFYRVRASFDHTELVELAPGAFLSPLEGVSPNRTRWTPQPIPAADEKVDFLDGLATLGGAGDPTSGSGYLVHLYAANADMTDRVFSSADGDLLLVPQSGTLECRTEAGWLRVPPGSIALIPRGIKFAIGFADGLGPAGGRGWMLEVFGRRLRLPERGLIGSNGLADARHFRSPIASYEDRLCPNGFQFVTKLGGRIFGATQKHSPFDVVAWHGTHVPCSYDLALFSPMGALKFDHQDPSIFTVLTAPFDDHGRAICDFVVFPGRWDVLENSFRPPFMHRNAATEVNCVVKTPHPEDGYDPGTTFLSPLLTSHGVATSTYDEVWEMEHATHEGPRRLTDESVWVMFESALPFRLSAWARSTPTRDPAFGKLFEGMRTRFDPSKP